MKKLIPAVILLCLIGYGLVYFVSDMRTVYKHQAAAIAAVEEEEASNTTATTTFPYGKLYTVVHDKHLFVVMAGDYRKFGALIHHPGCPCQATVLEGSK